MLLHAEKLVGFPIAEKFEEAVRDRIPEVVSFLRSVATKRLRNVDLELQHQHLNYIPALAAYFKEDWNVIFKIFEVILYVLTNILMHAINSIGITSVMSWT
ncbi:hypothetical protein AVEN_210124-1 [Araneus ventricosus]|uniref:Uncharacterized protein n=1 Tax=Araneus ventricosus TaxID=182803 RepID=A0A4Y2WIN6_ARAVE|nr:hypothetical protein AVEN_210124-1 [Araneus ventricosus]